MVKRILLNAPILLGLLTIDLIVPRLETGLTSSGRPLSAVNIVVILIAALLSIAYFIYWGKKQEFADWSFKNVWQNKGKIAIGILAFIMGLMIYATILALLIKNPSSVISANQQAINEVKRLVPVLLMWFTMCIAAPIMEETIFRLAVFKLILPGKDKTALVVSTILFALAHMQTEVTKFIAWPPYLIMGFILGYLYYKTKKIEVSTTVHMLWNSFSLLLPVLLGLS